MFADCFITKLPGSKNVYINTDILANALMVQNVADLTKALETLEQRGYPIKSEDVEHLSAYMTEHLQRFGDYTLKMRPVAPPSNEEELSA